jgi:hypothetical protein
MSPVSVAMLSRIGIETVSQLQSIGAVEVYARLKQSGEEASLPLLYALKAGVSGSNITDLSAARRVELVAVFASHHTLVPIESNPVHGENIGQDAPPLPGDSGALARTWPTRTPV